MKNWSLVMICATLMFLGCVMEEGQAPPQNVEESADRAKQLLDKYGDKAREFLDKDNGQLDKLKNLIDTLAAKGQGLEKLVKEKGPEWEKKLKELENNPEFKDKIKNLEGEAGGILKQIEELLKEAPMDPEK